MGLYTQIITETGLDFGEKYGNADELMDILHDKFSNNFKECDNCVNNIYNCDISCFHNCYSLNKKEVNKLRKLWKSNKWVFNNVYKSMKKNKFKEVRITFDY